ncbi:hypothetical protein [Sorangium sp. So ce887]|uniref:hypothetical protein n=1 Tax=Sorangium sp. So ce887 TaxID=3133324 RepID=UPI003F600066
MSGSDEQLARAAARLRHHALSLALVADYLSEAHGGESEASAQAPALAARARPRTLSTRIAYPQSMTANGCSREYRLT